eukprot:TRINITY_DN516_c3_g1_i3.p1 TRINITY_DN516_c3_g1~~TRINITY_DN516_c3_g1_i3.p1  ORF type:complete len:979 (-),score=300.78 TRINITY_DN516_c3_g1_i3:150-3086(-)
MMTSDSEELSDYEYRFSSDLFSASAFSGNAGAGEFSTLPALPFDFGFPAGSRSEIPIISSQNSFASAARLPIQPAVPSSLERIEVRLQHKPRGCHGTWLAVEPAERLRVPKGRGKRMRLELRAQRKYLDGIVKIVLLDLVDERQPQQHPPTAPEEGAFAVKAATPGEHLIIDLKVFKFAKKLQFSVTLQAADDSCLVGRSVEFGTHNSGAIGAALGAKRLLEAKTHSAEMFEPSAMGVSYVEPFSANSSSKRVKHEPDAAPAGLSPVLLHTVQTIVLHPDAAAAAGQPPAAVESPPGHHSAPDSLASHSATAPTLLFSQSPALLRRQQQQQQQQHQQQQQQQQLQLQLQQQQQQARLQLLHQRHQQLQLQQLMYEPPSYDAYEPVQAGSYEPRAPASLAPSVPSIVRSSSSASYASHLVAPSIGAGYGALMAPAGNNTGDYMSSASSPDRAAAPPPPPPSSSSLLAAAAAAFGYEQQQHEHQQQPPHYEQLPSSSHSYDARSVTSSIGSPDHGSGSELDGVMPMASLSADPPPSLADSTTATSAGYSHVTAIQGMLDVDGVVRAKAFVQFSDVRLKTHIADIVDAIDIVTRLHGKTYHWRSDAVGSSPDAAAGTAAPPTTLPASSRGDETPAEGSSEPATTSDEGGGRCGRRVIGLIAQEVQRVLPEVVREDPETGLLSVSYIEILPVLIEAFKQFVLDSRSDHADLQLQLDSLKAQMSTLEQLSNAKVRRQASSIEQVRKLTVHYRDLFRQMGADVRLVPASPAATSSSASALVTPAADTSASQSQRQISGQEPPLKPHAVGCTSTTPSQDATLRSPTFASLGFFRPQQQKLDQSMFAQASADTKDAYWVKVAKASELQKLEAKRPCSSVVSRVLLCFVIFTLAVLLLVGIGLCVFNLPRDTTVETKTLERAKNVEGNGGTSTDAGTTTETIDIANSLQVNHSFVTGVALGGVGLLGLLITGIGYCCVQRAYRKLLE